MKRAGTLFLVCVCLLLASRVTAQDGKITGRVTDSQGGILPSATVIATHVATGIRTTLLANASGIYVFPSLPPGGYTVAVSLGGFRSFIRENLVLLAGLTLSVDATLELAGVEEAMTVTVESSMIQLRESKVGGVVEQIQIENVPINERNVQELALLVPGAKPVRQFDPTKARVPAIGFGTSVVGREVLFTLDGGDNTDDAVGGMLQQVSMDSIQEFEVVTARMKAEYGRASSGVIKMVSKSGTNEFRGTVFEFFRDRDLNAKTQPEKDAAIEKGPFRRHQFGGALGGPILQDRAFFFVSYERIQEDVNQVVGVPPEVEARYDPAFVAEHGGFGVLDQPFRRNYLTAKYTQQLNERNRLDVRFAWEENSADGETRNSTITRDQDQTQTNKFYSLLGRFQTIVGSSALNEAIFQFSDFENRFISVLQPDFQTPGTPTLFFPSLTAGQNDESPQSTLQKKFQFRDNFSLSLATHDLKFGGEALRIDPVGVDAPFNKQGSFTYVNDGDPLAQAIFFSQLDPGPPLDFTSTDVGIYAQDDWLISESVTLNLGVRYDVQVGLLSGLEYGPTGEFLVSDPRSPFLGQVSPEDDTNNIAPRLGFTWDVGARGQTVVRGGWGLYYDKLLALNMLLSSLDSGGYRLVAAFRPPFGPDNIPPFETLFEQSGIGLGFDNFPAPDYVNPRSAQATIGVSHQITPTLAVDADYIHTDTSNLNRISDLNEMTIPLDRTSRLFWPERPNQLRIRESIGETEYNGLQLSLRKRMSNRIQSVVSYTLGRLEGNPVSPNEAECRPCIGDDRDVGPLPNDNTHRLVMSGIFLLPVDFRVSALFQAQSAPAISAVSSQDLNGNGRRTDFASGPNGEDPGRGNFRGGSIYEFDLRIAKFFRFGGTKELQLMFEMFNLFNTVNRGGAYIDTFESPSFGEPDGSIATNQFQIQLGVRFRF